MITAIGSQNREPIKDTDYRIWSEPYQGDVILQDIETGTLELWHVNNHFAGYVIRIGRWNYEFVREYTQES